MERLKSAVKFIQGFVDNMGKKHMSAYAAQAAYFIILSFIPFMLLLMTSIKYTPLTREEVINVVMQVCPESFEGFIRGIVWEVYAKSLGVVPISALIALWSAGKGIQALTNGFNSIYQVQETRNFFVTRVRSVVYTLVFVIAIILTLILQVFGNSLQRELSSRFPVLDRLVTTIISMRVMISLFLLSLVFVMMYKFIPNRKATFRSQLPGAVLSAVCWSAFSFFFSLYVDFFSVTSNMYGSMTTIVLILLWMYFCMMFVMIGAQVNYYFEEQFRWIRQAAAETIRKEYQLLTREEEEEDPEEEDQEGEKEKRNS
ncbi:MAG TPA: YihY/virulence factor BrkB family protein [Candidatus Blautia merdipullorum]|nr:YihY/virulence factor BrkB family protein [Candidatus Blautia merdipullorum]